MQNKMREIFLQSGKTYGARRVFAELRQAHGYTGSQNRVKRLMRQAGLTARAKRRFKATTDSNHALPVAPNRLEQRFEAERPDQVWLSDITYCWTREGWLYLCCVLDLFSREIVGWSMKESMTADVVQDALTMAKFLGAGYETRAEARRDIFSYIEGFYNCDRRHSALGYLSPREFERQFCINGVSSARKNGTNNSSTKA